MPYSTFLNGRTPTRLRGVQWLSFSESGNVLTAANTSDAGGGVTQVWSAGAAIPCRIDAVGGGEEVTAGRISDDSTHRVLCPANTAVTTNNRFFITGRGTFDITAVGQATDEAVRLIEVVESP